MDTIFMNSQNSKTSKPHVLIINLTKKSISLSNLSIYDTWKNIKSSYKNNKLQISAPKCNDVLKLTDGSYSISDIQDYFEYISKT